eukprot:gene11015-12179_t
MILLDQDFKGLVIRNSLPLQMVDGSRYCKISMNKARRYIYKMMIQEEMKKRG